MTDRIFTFFRFFSSFFGFWEREHVPYIHTCRFAMGSHELWSILFYKYFICLPQKGWKLFLVTQYFTSSSTSNFFEMPNTILFSWNKGTSSFSSPPKSEKGKLKQKCRTVSTLIIKDDSVGVYSLSFLSL